MLLLKSSQDEQKVRTLTLACLSARFEWGGNHAADDILRIAMTSQTLLLGLLLLTGRLGGS